MKKRLLVGLALVLLISTSFTSLSEVFICDSISSKKYHYSSSCRGLNACKHGVKRISLEEARDRGRTLCGWED